MSYVIDLLESRRKLIIIDMNLQQEALVEFKENIETANRIIEKAENQLKEIDMVLGKISENGKESKNDKSTG